VKRPSAEFAPVAGTRPARDQLALALDRLYEHHAGDVERWVQRLAGPHADHQDLVHDVFVVALRRQSEFRGDASLRTWLFRITHHVVRHRRKRDFVRRLLFARHAPALADTTPAPTAFDDLARRERTARLYAALDRLPDRYRTPLVLYELEGLSGEEVAELLGLELNTVWVRLHRARARLLAALKKDRASREGPR
jgi:RNA polymerase sigma-70 factor (ECF subfamily)